MQGKLWDDDYEFKAECFSNCFWLWSRCPSRIHLKDPPKPHTLMMPQGIVTPRSECSEVFFFIINKLDEVVLKMYDLCSF